MDSIKQNIYEIENEIAELFSKYEKINSAIEILENEGFNLPEKIYGKRDYYLSEIKYQENILLRLKRISNFY